MAFRIALTAGHYMGTPGKRCMKKLDKKQTREWWLNDRIADKVEKKLKDYTGYQLIRTDDTTGKKDISDLTFLGSSHVLYRVLGKELIDLTEINVGKRYFLFIAVFNTVA